MLWSHSDKRQRICTVPTCVCCAVCLLFLYVWAWAATQIWLSLCKTRACVCLPALSCAVHRAVCIYNHISTCHVRVCRMRICVCFSLVIPVEVMVSLCLSGVNPRHLAVIGSFLLYWNPKWLNHTSYGKQSIFGSDIHSTSKPQIAPIKGPIWHAHTNTQSFDLIWLVSISGRSSPPLPIGLSPHLSALLHRGSQLGVCEHFNVFFYAYDTCACVRNVSAFWQ